MAVPENLKNIVEAALLAAGGPLSLDAMQGLFLEEEMPEKKQLRDVLRQLADDYQGRGIEVAEVATGWRIHATEAVSPWISRLWSERPARYSRALMETLALIAYRQPITRGEIEDIRGVSVSSNIVKTLLEREWIRVVGQRDVPGKPSLYGTTREFLDYFNLKSLDELPTLAEIRDLDEINRELELEDTDKPSDDQAPATAADVQGEVAVGEAEAGQDVQAVPVDRAGDVDGDAEAAPAQDGPVEQQPSGPGSAAETGHDLVAAEPHSLVELAGMQPTQAEADPPTGVQQRASDQAEIEPAATDQPGDEVPADDTTPAPAQSRPATPSTAEAATHDEAGAAKDGAGEAAGDSAGAEDAGKRGDGTLVASYAPDDPVVPIGRVIDERPPAEPATEATDADAPGAGVRGKKPPAAMEPSDG